MPAKTPVPAAQIMQPVAQASVCRAPGRAPGQAPGRDMGRRQTGLSLVEVMVTIAISLVLMAGLIELFVANKQGYRIQEGISRLNEDARYAMTQIQHHLRMASHWGGATSADFMGAPPSPVGGCPLPPPPGPTGYVRGLRAFDLSQLCPAATAMVVADSHALITRFANAAQVPDAALQSNGFYVRSRIENPAQIFLNDAVFSLAAAFPASTALGAAAATNHAYEDMMYFLQRCTEPGPDTLCGTADDGDNIPILRRQRRDTSGIVFEDIAEGVEHFRFLFMLDATGAGDRIEYLPPAMMQSVTTYGDDPWQAVRGAYVQMLIRAPELDLSADDTTEYQFLSGPPYIPCGRDASNVQLDCPLRHHRRRLLTSLVQLRNNALGGVASAP